MPYFYALTSATPRPCTQSSAGYLPPPTFFFYQLTHYQWKFAAENLFCKSKALPPTIKLLGTKRDLRHRSASRRFSLGYYYQQLPLSASVQSVMASTCVSSAQAMWQAKYLNAKYYECSALTGEGVDMLVEETAAEATRAIVEKEYALYRGIKRMALDDEEN